MMKFSEGKNSFLWNELVIFLGFLCKAYDKNTFHSKVAPFLLPVIKTCKLWHVCDHKNHKKYDTFFNDLELSCHHFDFFRSNKLRDIGFDPYDLTVCKNVSNSNGKEQFYARKTKYPQFGIITKIKIDNWVTLRI